MTDLHLSAASAHDLNTCVDILMDSILGEEYFSRELALAVLGEGIANKEVYTAVNDSGEIVGFFRLVPKGVFLVFPYIHLLAIKTKCRGQGVGTFLLEEAGKLVLADPGYPDFKKVFLLVGKINRRAEVFYEKRGFRRVGVLDDLFSPGDTEFLMMKDVKAL